jgi:hypothetical protein
VCSSNINYFNALKRRLHTLLVKDDVFWKQWAKTHWYREGDLNTKFFHASATSRRAVNRITQLEDEKGVKCTTTDGVKGITKHYFLELFKGKDGDRIRVINVVPQSISTQDNNLFTRPFSIDEFR